MKKAYPIVITPEASGVSVYIPDFDANTQGDDIAHGIEMARDAIGLMGIDMEDDKKPLPNPTRVDAVDHKSGEIVSLVDVDFADYRRRNDLRTVRKNCTVPSWLCYAAEKANINFSDALQSALKQQLHANPNDIAPLRDTAIKITSYAVCHRGAFLRALECPISDHFVDLAIMVA